MTPSLLTWAADPLASPSPLPPQADRIARRDEGLTWPSEWPAALLGSPALASDLAARGVSYHPARSRQRAAYLVDGKPTEPVVIAGTAADILDEAAEALPATHRLDSHALVASARMLRTSRPAEGNLLRHLRVHLPEPVDCDVAAFLSAYDARDEVHRATLGREYVAADSPGGLTRHALYAQAADRWAPPGKSSEHYFHPAAALAAKGTTPASPFDDLSGAFAAIVERHGLDALAALVASATP